MSTDKLIWDLLELQTRMKSVEAAGSIAPGKKDFLDQERKIQIILFSFQAKWKALMTLTHQV